MNDHRGVCRARAGHAAALVVMVAAIALVAGCSDSADPNADGAGGGPPQGGEPPAKVRVAAVRVERVQDRRLVTGRLGAVQRSVVAAEEPGRVIEAPPDVGTEVDANSVITTLDRSLVRTERRVAVATLQEAQASVEQARATLDQARALRRRYAKLIDEGGVTQVALDQAVRDEQVAAAQLENARARVASRQASVEQLDIRLDKMVIRAPFDSTIVRKDTEVGQWLSPGSPVVTLVRTDEVDAELHVPERMVGALSPDQPVDVRVEAAGGRFSGRIHRIVPDADRRARTFPVLVRMDNPQRRMTPGMSAEAELPTGEPTRAIIVPRDAVQVTPAGMLAFVNRGGTATPAPISIRFTLGDEFVVDAPLAPGDQVVVEGNERLRPGQPLKVLNADAPSGSESPHAAGANKPPPPAD